MPNPAPFRFSPQDVDSILLRIEMGEMITVILRDYGVSHGRWHDQCDTDPEMAARYAKAKRHNADAMAEKAVEILEDQPGYTQVLDSKKEVVSERVDTGYVAWQKARFDARLKVLSLWDRDRYGDNKQHIDIGSSPGRPVQIEDKRDPATMALAIAAALRAKKRDGEPEFTDDDIDDLI